MKPAAIFLSLLLFLAFQVMYAGFIFRYTFDFLLAGLTLLLILCMSAGWAITQLVFMLRKKTISQRVCKRMMWIGLFLGIMACTQWGAFGLGALLGYLMIFVFPWIMGHRIKINETRIQWMFFIQSLFITTPLWFQFLHV